LASRPDAANQLLADRASPSSSLNLGYLEDVVDQPLVQETDRGRLWPLLRHSLVREGLEGMGYTTVAFETGYYWTEWEDADLYLAPRGWLSSMTPSGYLALGCLGGH
jgi:hypothetical protein